MITDVTSAGVTFSAKAHPGGKADRLTGIHDGMLKIEVTAVPEKGKANKAILKLLAGLLRVPVRNLSIVSGEKHTKKKVLAKDITEAELCGRISCVLKGRDE